MNNYKLIDLFCGAGGLTHGFLKEGFCIGGGIDVDKHCRYPYEKNNHAPFILDNIKNITASRINDLANGSRVILVGCAPCQPFTTYGKKANIRNGNGKWGLLAEFTRLVNALTPDIVSMENVSGLVNFKHGAIFDDFVSNLVKNGYRVFYKVLNAVDYGVPQRRKRLVLLASRLGTISMPDKDQIAGDCLTVADAIRSMPPLKTGGMCPRDYHHACRKMEALNMKRIRASTPGGTWRDWPEELRSPCHKKPSGAPFPSAYGRMCWDRPSPTITTCFNGYNNGRFGHPEQDRPISYREGALLQTFPSDYIFVPHQQYIQANLARLIGNAVPVRLGQSIARAIKHHLMNHHG